MLKLSQGDGQIFRNSSNKSVEDNNKIIIIKTEKVTQVKDHRLIVNI